jgi:hypothetical protein
VVVIGILRVVEEILEHRPDARVVINSIFPMTAIRGGSYPVISDFEDSFIRFGGARSRDRHQLFRRQLTRSRYKKETDKKEKELSKPPIEMGEDDVSDMAEKEEELRDEKAKKDRRYKLTPTKENPVMLDQTKVHKYKYGTPFVRQTNKPLWTSIRAINKELRKFAENNARVDFFDATDLFTEKTASNAYKLLTDRISIRGHPTEVGFTVWEDNIVKILDEILTKMKREQPDLFKPVSSWNNAPNVDLTNNFGEAVDDEVARYGDNDDFDVTLHSNDDGFDPKRHEEDAGFLPLDDNNDDEVEGSLIVQSENGS